MARRPARPTRSTRSTGGLPGAVAGAARVAARTPGQVRRAVVGVSWWLGWLGLLALPVLGALRLVAEDARPVPLADDEFRLAAVAALAVASLLGWGCMERGEERVRRAIGRGPALLLFVVIPVGLWALTIGQERGWADVAEWPGGEWWMLAPRVVPAALVAISLTAFLTSQARPRRRIRWGRGAWWLLLVTPYAALIALTVLRVPAPAEFGEPVSDGLAALAGGSIAAQLAIGYFLGDGATG